MPAALLALALIVQGYPPSVPRADGLGREPTPTIDTDPVSRLPYGQAGAPAGRPVADPNNAPFQGERPLVAGVADPAGPGRSLKVSCTTAGSATVTYADGSSGVWALAAGVQTIPIAVAAVSAVSGSCSFANLK